LRMFDLPPLTSKFAIERIVCAPSSSTFTQLNQLA
jgi:hypothetical protein